ncbi:MAG: hypothetical protein GY832_38070, partial [Chloroflexi bacterium]|nr:hypothetical protein [Chloroflexota bacterium]
MDQEDRNPKQDQSPHGEFAQFSELAQVVTSRTIGARSMLSPWVQRSLQPHAAATKTRIGIGQRRQTAFSEQHTRTLLDSIYRKGEGSKVWRPDVGSLEPTLVDRFVSTIVNRFPETGAKYEPQSLEIASAKTVNLALVGDDPMQSTVEAGELDLGAETEIAKSARYPSRAELEEAIAARSRWSRSPSDPGQPTPQVQRTTPEPAKPRQAARILPPRPRLFSQVEEVTP